MQSAINGTYILKFAVLALALVLWQSFLQSVKAAIIKVAPILGLAYRISAYRPTSTCIGIGCFVTGMADNQLHMRQIDHCHVLIILLIILL